MSLAHLICSWKTDGSRGVEGGLRVTRDSVGSFLVTRVDSERLKPTIVNIAIGPPQCSETTIVRGLSCSTHGLLCKRDGEHCSEMEAGLPAPRWTAYMAGVDETGTFEVRIVRSAKCSTLEEAKAAGPPERADADFFVQAFYDLVSTSEELH